MESTIARIIVFAFDLAEAAQRKRIDSLLTAGHDIRTVSFRRQNMRGRTPEFPNLDLGEIPNQRLFLRLALLLRALPKLFQHRSFLAGADIIIARNFDLLALAWLSRRERTPLIYECLDIHSVMTGIGTVNTLMRAVERFLLRRIQLLWTSSPGFLTHYFVALQNYRGPSVVVENKFWFGSKAPPRPTIEDRPREGGRLVLGWVGSIRCQSSFDILCAVAQAMPKDLKIEVHGSIHHHAVADFDARVDTLSNVTFHGPYSYPDGLAEVYGRCDLVWAQDLWQRGGNSDWLLPNRIYEASWYGCPSIAVAGTQTGHRVESDGLGPVIPTATAQDLQSCLKNLTRADCLAFADHILGMNDEAFRLTNEDVKAALTPILAD
ncbi:MAG: glycosyltransferase [Pseudomonadota bacterium]